LYQDNTTLFDYPKNSEGKQLMTHTTNSSRSSLEKGEYSRQLSSSQMPPCAVPAADINSYG